LRFTRAELSRQRRATWAFLFTLVAPFAFEALDYASGTRARGVTIQTAKRVGDLLKGNRRFRPANVTKVATREVV
jgi:hypothetical protein